MKILKLIIVVGLSLGLFGCQEALVGRHPTIYSGPSKTLTLHEDYVWTAGLAKVEHKFAAGEYRAMFEDESGYYFVQRGVNIGIYANKARTVVYGFEIMTKEASERDARAVAPGTLLVAKAIGLEPGVGDIGTQIIVNGDWKRAFLFGE